MSVAWKSGGHPMWVVLAVHSRGARSGLGTPSRAPLQAPGLQNTAHSIHTHTWRGAKSDCGPGAGWVVLGKSFSLRGPQFLLLNLKVFPVSAAASTSRQPQLTT